MRSFFLQILFPVLLLASPAGAAAAQEDARPAAIVPAEWLVLDPVDGRGRRPFRPDAVLRSVLLEGRAPAEGETLTGETGEASWRVATADADGRVSAGRIGYAATTVVCAEAGVRLARLSSASTLLIDGVPYAGDLYGYGHGGVPVALAAGPNQVLVTGIRGAFSLSFEPVGEGIVIGTWDLTIPDQLAGGQQPAEAGVLVMNASRERRAGIALATGGSEWFRTARGEVFGLEPLQVTHVPAPVVPVTDHPAFREAGELELPLAVTTVEGDGAVLAATTLSIPVRDPAGLQRHTFRSRVDGSVQEYVLLPPKGEKGPDAPMRLLLSLHGAGVGAWGQAASYAALPDFWIVAPTNRRPFGFDWQDWGRIDAYEVLDRALARSGVDRRRVYLGGHSMGGHGVWHLAANDPDGFAAIAPSAGWRSFDTYGGRPAGELRELWHASDAASDTEALIGNLVQLPTYILHGDADDNVPADEARAMETLLREAGAEPSMHLEEGKGHWWDAGVGPGTDCLAWPGFFELFRECEIPEAPLEIEFTTVDPDVDSRHHWVEVLSLREYGTPAIVSARSDPEQGLVTFDAENVLDLRLHLPPGTRRVFFEGDRAGDVWSSGEGAADAAELLLSAVSLGDSEDETGGTAIGWRMLERADYQPRGDKAPRFSGPLKRTFDRRFVLVVPTAGDEEENKRALERARYDGAVWAYRGNGHAPIARDVDLAEHPEGFRGRNVVLYGNADTNAAWKTVFGEDVPIQVRRGAVHVGDQFWEGQDLAALFVFPRQDDLGSLAGGLGTTGAAAESIATTLATFVSGVGYPDYAVVGLDVLEKGDGGVRTAGWFDAGWKIPTGR